MRYFVIESNNVILAIGSGTLGKEISFSEYEAILGAIENCPDAPEGFFCQLKTDLTWEMVEARKTEEELTDSEALDIIMGVQNNDTE